MILTEEQNAKLWDIVCELGREYRRLEHEAAVAPTMTHLRLAAENTKREYKAALKLFIEIDVED